MLEGEKTPDAFELILRLTDQPAEENGQHSGESICREEWLELHRVSAVLDQLGMQVDCVLNARTHSAGR